MAYIPDDLFDELHRELSPLMFYFNPAAKNDYECVFCCASAENDRTKDIDHSNDCLGTRLMRAIDAEKRSQLGSG